MTDIKFRFYRPVLKELDGVPSMEFSKEVERELI